MSEKPENTEELEIIPEETKPETEGGESSQETLPPEEPKEEKPVFDEDQQKHVNNIVGKRSEELKTQFRVQEEKQNQEIQRILAENTALNERLSTATTQNNNLVAAVNKDELTDVPEDLRRTIELPETKPAVVQNITSVRNLEDYTPQESQQVSLSVQSLGIKAREKYEGDNQKAQLLESKFEFFANQGLIPIDMIAVADSLPNSIGIIEKLVDDETYRNNVLVAAFEAKKSGGPVEFISKIKELSKDLTINPTTDKKTTPKTETSPGRRQGSMPTGTQDVEIPVLDLG